MRCVRWLYRVRIVRRACIAVFVCESLLGCSAKDGHSFPAQDILDTIRSTDLSAHAPGPDRPSGPGGQTRPLLVPGSSVSAEPGAPAAPGTEPGAPQNGGIITTSAGVEFNFDSADIQTVAKTLVGTSADLRDLVRWHQSGGKGPPPRILQGWRAEVCGELLRDVLNGRIALRVADSNSDHPLVFERSDKRPVEHAERTAARRH